MFSHRHGGGDYSGGQSGRPADWLLGIGGAEEIEKGSPTQRCPVCGFTQADFKKTGRLGCSTCYATFTEALTALLKAMHKGTAHVGKVPERAHRAGELSDKMRNLSESLQKAVAEENYETAASLRDQIKQLESELAGQGRGIFEFHVVPRGSAPSQGGDCAN